MTTSLPRVGLITLVAATVPLLGIAAAHLFWQASLPDMTRDVTAIAGIHPLTGILSSLGILLWWTSAAIYFFAAFVQRGHQGAAGVGFLVYSGCLSAYLGFDDLFLIHEYLAPIYLKVSERLVYVCIALATVVYLGRYRRILQGSTGLLLLLALMCLAGSVAIDTFLGPLFHPLAGWSFYIEDALKWLGICFWTAFCVTHSSGVLRSRLLTTSSQ